MSSVLQSKSNLPQFYYWECFYSVNSICSMNRPCNFLILLFVHMPFPLPGPLSSLTSACGKSAHILLLPWHQTPSNDPAENTHSSLWIQNIFLLYTLHGAIPNFPSIILCFFETDVLKNYSVHCVSCLAQ